MGNSRKLEITNISSFKGVYFSFLNIFKRISQYNIIYSSHLNVHGVKTIIGREARFHRTFLSSKQNSVLILALTFCCDYWKMHVISLQNYEYISKEIGVAPNVENAF